MFEKICCKKKNIKAIVVSDKMQKTIVAKIIKRIKHPVYNKIVTKITKIFVHDENKECKIGDIIFVKSHRPISKKKNWIFVSKAKVVN